MVVFDTGFLVLLLDPLAEGPTRTAAARVKRLAQELDRRHERIVVPTPALSELLVKLSESGPRVVERLAKSSAFKLASFDERAAIEVAHMTREALEGGDKRAGSTSSWQKVKYDRQIVAIGRVAGARAIYSDDKDVRLFAARTGLLASSSAELPEGEPQEIDMFADRDPDS